MNPTPRRQRLLGVTLASALAVLAGCSDTVPAGWSGYVEGDYVYIAAPVAGTLQRLDVQAGQAVQAGASLFTLESDSERAARLEAEARWNSARAQAANVQSGKRAQELAVTEAQLGQARAQAELARSALAREQGLLAQGFVSAARMDDLRTALAQAQARVAELTAALDSARLPARQDERASARALAEAAEQTLAQASWRERQKQQAAPQAALVADTYYRVGEWVAAGQPVLQLLPPTGLKARFFVPETEIASLRPGQMVELRCDGCAAPLAARITTIASSAEYTPPVIYSNAQRAKLVFRVDARLDGQAAAALHPGLPIEVRRGS